MPRPTAANRRPREGLRALCIITSTVTVRRDPPSGTVQLSRRPINHGWQCAHVGTPPLIRSPLSVAYLNIKAVSNSISG